MNEHRFTTLINMDGEYIRIEGKEIHITDIPVLMKEDMTINELKNQVPYVHIDFSKVQLIGINICSIYR